MGIVLERVLAMTPAGARAVVRHEEQTLEVEVIGSSEQIASKLGALVNFEFDFAEVKAWKVLGADVREEHGLFAAGPELVRVVGVVHNIIDAGEGRTIVDIYVQAGPEFLSVDSKQLSGAALAVGSPTELVLSGVRCFPLWE
jgi:hypothetical protein